MVLDGVSLSCGILTFLSGGRNMISVTKRFKYRPCPSVPKETAHTAYLYHTMQLAVPFLFEKEFYSFWPAGMGIDAHSSVIKTEQYLSFLHCLKKSSNCDVIVREKKLCALF